MQIKDAGRYRVWVRYSSHPKWRGPFHLTALSGARVLGDGLFDADFKGKSDRDKMVWHGFEVELPEGEVTLRLSKHQNQNSPGISRMVDCVLLTMDLQAMPSHLDYGAQTFMRVTLHDGHDTPAYIHICADHYHAVWYAHWSLGKSGTVQGVQVKGPDLLRSGESTPWCIITPTLYQDSGAMLYITARHGYTDHAARLKATIDFATAADEKCIVRSYEVDNAPGAVVIYAPPDLVADGHRSLLKRDLEIAGDIDRRADAHPWPTHGRKPEKFPFLVSASIDRAIVPRDARVYAREQKTLGYFGFNERPLGHVGGCCEHGCSRSFLRRPIYS